MSREMVISANPHETRVAILEEGQLCEYYVEREKEFALVGSIYKGRVTRVLPGMQSAFVDIGLDSDAFLYVSDFLEETEEVDHIVDTVEDKVQKMEAQGGEVFAPSEQRHAAVEPGDVDAHASAENANASGAEPSSELATAGTSAHGGEAPSEPQPSGARPRYDRPERSERPSYSQPSGGGRGRFDNRGGRRDFGRRGGRGRHGHGRHGDRRSGRELPQSKYAPRYTEDQSAPPSGDYTPIILPGESLAKYRTPSQTPASVPETHEEASATPSASAHETVHHEPEAHSEQPYSGPIYPGFGPLPGETLSKYQASEPSAAVRPIIPAEPFPSHPEPPLAYGERRGASGEVDAIESAATEAEASGHEELAHDASEIAGLSEDQAATLAAHVAEAQIEEEAEHDEEDEHDGRDSFAASDEAQHSVDDDVHLIDEEDEEHEEHEEHGDVEDALESLTAEASEILAGREETEVDEGADGPQPGNSWDEPRPGKTGEPSETQPQTNESSNRDESGQPREQRPWQARVRGDLRSRMQRPNRRGGGRDRGRDRGDRGRRDDRSRRQNRGYGHHRQQPRRPQLIADLLKQGQEIIVQIAKEPLGKKGARITSHVALPGRFLVYMPTLDHTGVSRKIASAEDRARLRHLVNDAKGSAGGGFIVRTAAGSATQEEVRADVEFLTRTWSEIKARAEQRKAPSLLHRDLNLVERILRDYVNGEYSAIWVDSEEEFTKVVDFMSRFQPDLVNRVKLYTKEAPVFEEFGIQQEIDKGLRPKVWLKSGGYIVINHTEALVAIDVNTGKFVGKGSTRLEDTIVRTNLEAVKEIVRQMRLRDLGGIIIIDFIDMEERRNREKVMAALEDALRADRAPSKVLRFNEFGLVAITRKRTKQALERTLCQPCPYCTGSGMVKSIPTLCYEIQAEARKMAPETDSGSLTLRVHPEISKALKTRESGLIEELERTTKKSVIIQADPTLHWEQYDIY
ncbi:MAG TPA: Rne/Rng family ribonuclease [Candidatus Acidoferrales bacterium]|nr:Rne/Rng family ribonuclease [Candidatus Acidoferrales bacterium]